MPVAAGGEHLHQWLPSAMPETGIPLKAETQTWPVRVAKVQHTMIVMQWV